MKITRCLLYTKDDGTEIIVREGDTFLLTLRDGMTHGGVFRSANSGKLGTVYSTGEPVDIDISDVVHVQVVRG